MASYQEETPSPLPGKFLRLLGLLWLSLVSLALLGNALAPHLGRGTDTVLQYVWHWDWTVLQLQVDHPFFDLSTPETTLKSYYSALYRGDLSGMDHLTQGAFREQMRQRLQTGDAASGSWGMTYRSYIVVRKPHDDYADVYEKSHLFWQTGLRFRLQRVMTTWHIVAVEILPEAL